MPTTIKGTTDRPRPPADVCPPVNEEQDYVRIIEDVLAAHPQNRVIEDSLLFQRALQQVKTKFGTTNATNATTVRPAVPDFLCGFINPGTGVLRTSAQLGDEDITFGRISPQVVTSPDRGETGAAHPYGADRCLGDGLPGSSGYLKCQTGIDDPAIEISGIDWSSAFTRASTAAAAANAAARASALTEFTASGTSARAEYEPRVGGMWTTPRGNFTYYNDLEVPEIQDLIRFGYMNPSLPEIKDDDRFQGGIGPGGY